MSQIRAAKAIDTGAFPGSTFVINNTPPITQCQESQLVVANVDIATAQKTITKIGAFAGINLSGKKVTVAGSTADDGTYEILSNTNDILNTDHTFIFTETFTGITIHDPAQAYLTRNESSFTRFIENEGKAHTTKAGQLYTNLPDPPMNDACTDTWNPQ